MARQRFEARSRRDLRDSTLAKNANTPMPKSVRPKLPKLARNTRTTGDGAGVATTIGGSVTRTGVFGNGTGDGLGCTVGRMVSIWVLVSPILTRKVNEVMA